MIKLNNKNITYVALADSNNSLKAPKEIWYADSNNSVKLVHRRKDALIEGEDYEKYHWLQGRNGAYIDTRYVPIPNEDSFRFKINNNGFWENPNNNDPHVFGTYLPRIRFGTFAKYENKYFFQYSNVIEGSAPSFTSPDYIQEVTLLNDGTKTKCIANGIENEYETTITEQFNDSIWLYAINNAPSKYFHGDIAYFKITDPTFTTDKLHLIPCKLLKPVPKWLDANGIRRQVGECGMIDLVSGKFYGNVNSVGTFTVENYYERKEWLIANIPIGTNIMTLPVNSDTLYFRRVWKSFGNSSYFLTNKYDYYTYFYQQKVSIYSSEGSEILGYFGSMINVDEVIEVDSNSERIIMHNVEVPKYGFPITSISLDNKSNGVNSVTHYTSVISVDGIERYIPCTLTMDLPASMDANGIARTKGTSGMWDLVSDRFYGNVANSGTFKAVNLAEGVDYEVHQWLEMESVGEAAMMSLPIHSYSFAFSRKMLSGTNVPYFNTEGGNPTDVYLNTSNAHTVSIWNNNRGLYYNSGQSFNRNNAVSFISTNEELLVNSQVIPQYAFPVKSIIFTAADSNGTVNYTSSITVDGIERYIPVKLLKSIPSKYDANGIARQAGECGMYDTINDVFYGNVASSGSFSVEDN